MDLLVVIQGRIPPLVVLGGIDVYVLILLLLVALLIEEKENPLEQLCRTHVALEDSQVKWCGAMLPVIFPVPLTTESPQKLTTQVLELARQLTSSPKMTPWQLHPDQNSYIQQIQLQGIGTWTGRLSSTGFLVSFCAGEHGGTNGSYDDYRCNPLVCFHAFFATLGIDRREFILLRSGIHHPRFQKTCPSIWCTPHWLENHDGIQKQWQILTNNIFHWAYGGSPNDIGRNFQMAQLADNLYNPRIGEGHLAHSYTPGWKYGIEPVIKKAVSAAKVERVIRNEFPTPEDKQYVRDLAAGIENPTCQERVFWDNPEACGNLGFPLSPDYLLTEAEGYMIEEEYLSTDLSEGEPFVRMYQSCSSSSAESVFPDDSEEEHGELRDPWFLADLREQREALENPGYVTPLPESYEEWVEKCELNKSENNGRKWMEFLSSVQREIREQKKNEMIFACAALRLSDQN